MVAFEQANMEDIMETSALQEVEALGHCANALHDLERSDIARAELALGAGGEGLSGAVQQPQPNPVAHLKLHLTMTRIIVLLGQLLSLQKMLSNLGQNVIAGAKNISSFYACRPWSVCQHQQSRAPVDDLKRGGV